MALKSSNTGAATIGGTATFNVTNWSESRTNDVQAYVSSQTGGRTFRVKGNYDVTFSIDVLIDATELNDASLDEGETITLTLTHDGQDRLTARNVIITDRGTVTDIGSGSICTVNLSVAGVDATTYAAIP